MEPIVNLLLTMLCVSGMLVAALLMLCTVCAGVWLILRFADYWGCWMDAHPEREGRKPWNR